MPLKLVKRSGSPHWYISGSVRGSRYFESTGTGSRRHAEALRLTREREILDAEFYGEAKATIFADAAAVYLEKGGEGRFLVPILERFGKLRLPQITPADVSRFARERYGHLSPASVKRQLYTPLNAVMRAAHRAQLGPLQHYDPPKVPHKPVVYADDRWLGTFLEHAHFRVAAVVLFMTLTGARVSEACRLAPDDVYIDDDEPKRCYVILRKTKSGKSRRAVLAPVLVDALRGAIQHNAKTIDGQVRVFGYASRWSVNQAIERVCVKAGLPVLSSHKVGRHAAAARLLATGASLKTLQAAYGWASMRIAADTYGHLEQQAVDEAVRAAGAGLRIERKKGKGE